MNNEEIFSAWAPKPSLWSPWTKAVLFAQLTAPASSAELPPAPADLTWCPPKENHVAIIVDLTGAESVLMGAALAQQGYRPVPLFNALPLPGGHILLDPLTRRNVAAVDVLTIIAALRAEAPKLAGLEIPAAAPPAFLLDANRQGGFRHMFAGEFDNRSVCFTTDFPSANFLLAQGIRNALVVQAPRNVQSDLPHVLRRWQDGGLALELVPLSLSNQSETLDVPRPSWYGAMFQRAVTALGLRRHFGGGFGSWVPEASAGG